MQSNKKLILYVFNLHKFRLQYVSTFVYIRNDSTREMMNGQCDTNSCIILVTLPVLKYNVIWLSFIYFILSYLLSGNIY